MVYNCKIISYANNKQQIRFYSNSIHRDDRITELIQQKREITKQVRKERGDENDSDFSIYVSMQRTVNAIFNITRSNNWDLFCNFTFDKKRVNRYDYDMCMDCAKEYFKMIKKYYNKDFKYIIVPEKHKDGAWHIHGLCANIENVPLKWGGKIDNNDRKVYNMVSYIYGFTECTFLTDNFAACCYMTKYVTKNMCYETMYRNRYFTSKNVHIAKEKEFRISTDRLEKVLSNMDNILFAKTVESGDENYTIFIETENNEHIFDEFIDTGMEFEDLTDEE